MNIIVGLLGVLLGFLLGQFGTTWREISKGKEAKKLILEEMKSNLALLIQKRIIVLHIVDALANKKLLPGESVRFMTMAYDLNLHIAYPYLDSNQRDSLHVFYERVKQADSFLARYESELLKHLDLKLWANPFDVFELRMKEILESLRVVEDLGKKYVEGNPVDVFRRNPN